MGYSLVGKGIGNESDRPSSLRAGCLVIPGERQFTRFGDSDTMDVQDEPSFINVGVH